MKLNKRLINALENVSDDVKINSLPTYSIPYSDRGRLYITEFPEGLEDKWTGGKAHKPGFYLKYAGLPISIPFKEKEGLNSRELMKCINELLMFRTKD